MTIPNNNPIHSPLRSPIRSPLAWKWGDGAAAPAEAGEAGSSIGLLLVLTYAGDPVPGGDRGPLFNDETNSQYIALLEDF